MTCSREPVALAWFAATESDFVPESAAVDPSLRSAALALQQSIPADSLLVGAVGHLLLSRDEEAAARKALQEQVVPQLLRRAGARPVTLLAGLAPGADLLLMRELHGAITRAGLVCTRIGLCAVPTEHLVGDWLRRFQAEGYTLSTRDRHALFAEVEQTLAACDALILLHDPDRDLLALENPAFRDERYRRQSALLAQRGERLVAVLRAGEPVRPGGTAETVHWRRDPKQLPDAFRLPSPMPPPAAESLLLIDPGVLPGVERRPQAPLEIQRTLDVAEQALKAGNDLLANDIVYRALGRGLSHPELSYLRVLTLANVGSTDLALRQYQALAPAEAQRDLRWITLLGRLRKDLALRSRSTNRRLCLDAAQAYLDAWQRFGGAYAAVNAATLFVLAQEPAQGRHMAERALDALASEAVAGDETERYFQAATRAEATLVLGDLAAAEASLRDADRLLPGDLRRRSGTLRQLRRLCAAQSLDPALLRALKVPPLVLLRRLGQADPGLAVDSQSLELPVLPVHATLFAGLCDPYDLRLCERLQADGHRLHVATPYRPERLLEVCRQRLGAAWGERLERCLAAAVEVFSGRGFLPEELAWAASHVTERMLGLSLLSATRFGGSYRIIEVGPERRPRALPELDAPQHRAHLAASQVRAAEPPAATAPGRRMVGLIFADFAGFQRIEDPDLPRFWSTIMRALAQILERHGESILLRQTWGDALHVVTTDAATAAAVMSEIQHYLGLHQLKQDSGLASLQLRIAGHYAPVFEGTDPVTRHRTYYGSQLSLTARVEPVTPPGGIYATEALAAQLAIDAPAEYACEYVGEVELAKRFGAYRLYALHPLRS